MPLAAHHLSSLRSSRISDAVIESRGYATVTTVAELRALGFGRTQEELVPALAIPVWDVHGHRAFACIRPDSPRIDAKGKPRKYEFPAGIHMDLDVPPLVRDRIGDPSVTLWITEGCKKADSAVSLGLCCVAVVGVWNWRGKNEQGGKTALAAWESVALEDRLVYLAFDSDAMEKRPVYQALQRCKEFLRSRGARVRVVYLPPGPDGAKTGLDDFFARGGTVDQAIRSARSDLLQPREPERDPGADESVSADQRLNLTDLGNARRLVRDHGRDLRYCNDWKSWLVWDGQRWSRDRTGEVQRRVRSVVAGLYGEAASMPGADDRKAIISHATKSESRRALEASEDVARSEAGIAVATSDLDTDDWGLCVGNGMIDLRTGVMRSHRREDLCTKVCGASFDPSATAPLWEAFLHRIMGERADLVEFLQRAVGYSLTGSTREQVLFLCHGNGANGKSTFVETLRHVLGDYAAAAKFDTFIASDNRGDAREDLARLRGARLVSAVESPEGKRFDEAAIKQLTGSDTINARFLYANSFEFRPTCKIWLAANHRPSIRGEDDGIWRRIRLIPFSVQIPVPERDPDLGSKLQAEAAGILAWSVRGAVEWSRNGLGTHTAVDDATAEYREDCDTIGEFLDERCDTSPVANVRCAELFRAYAAWAQSRNERPMSTRAFQGRMKSRGGVVSYKDSQNYLVFQGLRVKAGA